MLTTQRKLFFLCLKSTRYIHSHLSHLEQILTYALRWTIAGWKIEGLDNKSFLEACTLHNNILLFTMDCQ